MLLMGAAALFAVGTTAEKDSHAEGPRVEGHVEGGESAEHLAAERGGEEGEATVLGVDRESSAVVALALAISLALAALLWFRPGRSMWIFTGAVALGFAAFDVAEVVHQVDVSESGLAALAGAVVVLHLGVVGAAVLSRR